MTMHQLEIYALSLDISLEPTKRDDVSFEAPFCFSGAAADGRDRRLGQCSSCLQLGSSGCRAVACQNYDCCSGCFLVVLPEDQR